MYEDLYDGKEVLEAASLVCFGLQPRERPANNHPYHELVQKYLYAPTFRNLVDALTQGLKLTVLQADQYGVILEPLEGSPFGLTTEEYRSATGSEDRVLGALVNFALMATFFPNPQDLKENVNISPGDRSVDEVEETLHTIGQRLEQQAQEDPDPLVDEVQARLLDTWRVYQTKVSGKRTIQGRPAASSTTTIIRRAFEFLRSHDCMKVTERGYQPTRRYQVHVQQWSASLYYQALQDLLSSPPPERKENDQERKGNDQERKGNGHA